MGFRNRSKEVHRSCALNLQGPQIITVPRFDTPARYWIVPFSDAYYNIWGAIGSHFNSTAGQYLVVGRSKPQLVHASLGMNRKAT